MWGEDKATSEARAYLMERIVVEDRGYLTPCWVWKRALTRYGYGQGRVAGKTGVIHRAAYEAFVGPIPPGLQIDHLCRVRSCCNPNHLEPVTSGENTRRGLSAVPHTHCRRGHEFTAENSLPIYGKGGRRCRTCWNERQRLVDWPRRKAKLAARAKLVGGRAEGAGDRTLTDNVRTHCASATNR